MLASEQPGFRIDSAVRLPVIIGVVIAVAFLLQLASFRSPALAVKAAILNLFSIGAAYDVIVAAFHWDGIGPCVASARRSPSSPTCR